jgi:hypothetical protein
MRLAALVVLGLLAGPTAARADAPAWGGGPPGAAPHPPLPAPVLVKREVSYALGTLSADSLAAALVGGALLLNDPFGGAFLGGPGIMIYALGGPVVHFGQRRYVTSLLSFGVRIAAPYVGAKVGNLTGSKDRVLCGEDCSGSRGSTLGSVIGVGVGALAAIVLDARFLARKPVHHWAAPVAPAVGYNRTGFTLGLTGAF